MKFNAKTIADFLKGEVDGDPDIQVDMISKIEEGKPGTLSFLANSKYEKYIYTTSASIVLVNREYKPEKEISSTLIRVEDPYKAFAALLELYHQYQSTKSGIDKLAYIDNTVSIGEKVYVGAFAYISKNVKIGHNVKLYPGVYLGDNVTIGDNTVLRSGVKVYRDCKIGSHCVFHSNVVVGSDGFGFVPQKCSQYKKIPQVGNVIIEDNVEIGANSTIDRATLGSTIIRKGVKLDNLIQIGHNVEIGENTVIAAQSGVSGSTKIGRDCMIGGQVGIVGHIIIADEVKIAAQSGIGSSILEKGAVVQGSPAFGALDYRRSYVMFKKNPEFYQTISALQQEIESLKKKIK